jgi:hypothetical protein
MWFNLAASAPSNHSRSLSIKDRANIEAMMTPAQIAEAQRMARDWKPK